MEPHEFPKLFGMDFDHERSELLTTRHIKPSDLALEKTLFQHKWHDYRRLHPLQATYLFVHDFMQVRKELYIRYFDNECKGYWPFRYMGDFLKQKPSVITSLWKARQSADVLGMPYELFNRAANKAAMEQEYYKQMPMPAQLYSEDVIERVAENWEIEKAGKLRLATDPMFLKENFEDNKYQLDYREYLKEQVSKRSAPEYALSRCLHQLDEEFVVTNFGQKVFDRAVELANSFKS